VASDISRTRSIAAGPQEIWGVLADFGALSSWADGVDHSCVLEPGHGGGPIGTARRVQIGRNTVVERIVECESGCALAYDIAGLPPMLGRLRNRWTLAPAGAGVTAVTLTSTVDIGAGGPQRFAERVICRVLAKQSDALLAGLAKRLENQHV
jgi:Polyketide cyclase / dehydrase and lipid transport